jgi:malate dehydrogenase
MISTNVKRYAPEAVVIVATNPVDALCHVVRAATGFDSERVFGLGGVLDGARFEVTVSEHVDVGPSRTVTNAIALGRHGKAVLLASQCLVDGDPLTTRMSAGALDRLILKAQRAGDEILNDGGRGSALYGPAAAICSMVDAMCREDPNEWLSCIVSSPGTYGTVPDVYIGLEATLDMHGAHVVEAERNVTPPERAAIQHASREVADLVRRNGLDPRQ